MSQKIDTKTDQLLCEVEDQVATIMLNRPEKRNALGDVITPALRSTLSNLETNDDVRVIIITGAGKAFCSGGDVSGMKGKKETSERDRNDIINDLQEKQRTLSLRLYNLSKPTIAVIPGAAAGAGMSIALSCDMRICGTSGFFVTGFGNIGLSGDYGGSWQLTKIVGPAKAKELYFTGRRIESKEALSLGLINEVIEDDLLFEHSKEVARLVASKPPKAISFMKLNINQASEDNFETCLDWEAVRQIHCMETKDFSEGVSAFQEKRKPKFMGM
ncbi:MAG: enoyl-CoA hydratase [Alphaproteobacteria bacterium]|jgi:2-(1,2-epoxy-1,2-dihydrophenyl)acetyl-CoA isomerase|nr:enoyl-CoA hydratase [Alphaproteobacteria bacterium]PPR13552.1 MAG: Short-chain-enoyl-CoA hydratase [Alphaproteobacteria bacterium MarineAlpha12_Bin1]|tara:strand:- start:845 stop:1663 length:819 start_codon:yes stop_codon:yes gene_type:complete